MPRPTVRIPVGKDSYAIVDEAVACRKQAEVKYQWGDLING